MPGAVLCRRAALLVQERSLDLLDVDAAVLHRFDRIGELKEFSGSGLGIGVGARLAAIRAVQRGL